MAEVLGPPRYDSLPDHVRDALSRERDHIPGLHPADPAAIAAQAWIEVMEAVPWRRAPAGPLDTPRALRRTLDREHVGRDPRRGAVRRGRDRPGRIPPLLRERLEPLPLAGYDDEEEHRIATRHLLRQWLMQHGLSPDELSFSRPRCGS